MEPRHCNLVAAQLALNKLTAISVNSYNTQPDSHNKQGRARTPVYQRTRNWPMTQSGPGNVRWRHREKSVNSSHGHQLG